MISDIKHLLMQNYYNNSSKLEITKDLETG